MNAELISIFGVGAALAGLIISSFRSLNARLMTVEQGVSGLWERMARLEGLFEGFTRPKEEN